MKMRLAALLTFAIGFVVPTFAQQAKDLVGTWTLVSIILEKDGKSTDAYGPNPMGQTTYGADGRFSTIIARSDLPKFVSNNRMEGTPEENKAVVQGSFAEFGTYSVRETDQIITQHVESSTFPNFNGSERKLSISISGDELHVTLITKASAGGTAHLVWKRPGLAATAATTQAKNTPDPELRDQLIAFDKKFDEAFNNNDAAAVAALFTEDAVFVTDRGPIYGREAIEKCFADWFRNVHFSNHVTTDDQDSPHVTGTANNEMWATGKWSQIFQVQKGSPTQANGYWAAVKIRDGDVWKMRMNIYNTTPSETP